MEFIVRVEFTATIEATNYHAAEMKAVEMIHGPAEIENVYSEEK